MSTMASQITSLMIVYWSVYSGAFQRKQSSASLAFVRGIHRWSVNSPHIGAVTQKMFPFDDIMMHRIGYMANIPYTHSISHMAGRSYIQIIGHPMGISHTHSIGHMIGMVYTCSISHTADTSYAHSTGHTADILCTHRIGHTGGGAYHIPTE